VGLCVCVGMDPVGPQKCKMMKERTEGWLVVRISQVSKVELTVPP
jgi:hypothetical protein